MLKIGVGPSSSHTLGPWRAVQRWLAELAEAGVLDRVERVQIHLYGSLALTGRGHCTDQAVWLALLGHDPVTIEVERIGETVAALRADRQLRLGGRAVPFDPEADTVFHPAERLPGHANGMTCVAVVDGAERASTYYSVGGGFVVAEGEARAQAAGIRLPRPAQVPAEMLEHCREADCRIADSVWENERAWRTDDEIRERLRALWAVMREGVFRGCHTEGVLPGGLGVERRAAGINRRLLPDDDAQTSAEWIAAIRGRPFSFKQTLQWVSAFALAVNEENANLGRVVTAPTNGAAGVIPAVLFYLVCFSDEEVTEEQVLDFLLVAGEVGTFFKKGATISAAMGGCQAEVGVSSAMAAAALCEAEGGTPAQAFQAAEIAMEHHLGMTCDPVAGLVQIPCIERNTMGAVKAINAAELALAGAPDRAKVSLDAVIRTLRETAEGMSDRFKETSQGGLATNVSVRFTEC
ncbi:L-serine ammonia-lyase [Rubrivirga marina]|uniref:L-serine dehydratase n=2 Tax=Rubrivirga marina TaxID=1196024 RepID=A0A271J6F0_9BACT|nr:L-serine ammonia-lyase [Rubrivirga marina]